MFAFIAAAFVTVSFLMGDLARERRRRREQLEDRARRLQVQREQEVWLATTNAARYPGRTSTSALALLIGVLLVATVLTGQHVARVNLLDQLDRERPVDIALSPADVAPAASVGDVAELLHVYVEHRAGMVVLVAAHRFASGVVNVGEPVQARADQDPVNSRGSDARAAGQLHRALSKAEPQLDAAPSALRAGLVRRPIWP